MKKKRVWIIVILLLALTVVSGESCMYYGKYLSNLPLYLEMVLHNIIRFCLLSPEISIEDVAKMLGENSSVGQITLAALYGVSVLGIQLAAIVTLFQVVLIKMSKLFYGLFMRKDEHIFIFGNNDKVQILLENECKERKRRAIHLVSEENVSKKQLLLWLGEGIFYHQGNLHVTEGEALIKWMKKIGIRKAKRVLLFEEDAFKNLKWFYILKAAGELPEDIRFHVYSTNTDVNRLFVEAQNGAKSRDDYYFFDLYDMRVRELLSGEKAAIHAYNKTLPDSAENKYDVHVLVVGFGKLGEEFLKQALNLAVLSPDSKIVFDIIGKNIACRKLLFESNFSDKYVNIEEDSISLKGNGADGELLLRFHEKDVCGIEYRKLLDELSGEMPITYVAVCLERAELAVRCALETKRKCAIHVPIATRMEVESFIMEALAEGSKELGSIIPIGAEKEVLRLDVICDTEQERQCHEFNFMYDAIVDSVPWDKSDYIEKALNARKKEVEDKWNTLPYYKKEANRKLYAHRMVRKWLSEGHDVRGEREFLVKMAKTEHRRWNYFMTLEGWSYTGGKKDEDAKLTPYLCNWETLEADNPEVCAYDLLALMTEHGPEEN